MTHLKSYQDFFGGFGAFGGYDPTLLDTAFALKALATRLTANLNEANNAIYFILDRQNLDGSFNEGINESDLYLTALIIEALWDYRHHVDGVTSAIAAAKNWLFSQKNTDELWGEHFISAEILIALLPTETDNVRLSASLQNLASAQQSNGSWGDDVFTTAKALRALHMATLVKPDQASLSGRVMDAETQTVLSGVSLTLTSNGTTLTRVTDAQGDFSFHPLTAGQYQLSLNHNGYSTLQTSTELNHGQHLNLGTIRLLRDIDTPQDSAILQGNITDTHGVPLSGVSISVNETLTAITDSTGYYQILAIPPGDISISASKSGYQSQQATAMARANETLLFSSQLQAFSNKPASLSGVIIDKQTQQALAGVTLTLSGANEQTQQSGADGSYRFDTLNSGSTTITATHIGYHSEKATIEVQAGTNFIFSPQLTDSASTPEPQLAGLMGAVIDNVSQLPLTGVTVQLSNGASQQTDTNGQFNFTNLNDIDVTLTLEKNGYQSQLYPLTLSHGVILDIGTLPMTPLTGDYNFHTVIVDSTSNQPLANVQVLVSNEDNQSLGLISNEQGEVTAEHLSQPLNHLQVSLTDYKSIEFDVLLTPVNLNELGQIRLRPNSADQILPDLVIKNLDNSQLSTDPASLQLSGTLDVTILNQGNASSEQNLTLLAYYDSDNDQQFNAQQDSLLGSATLETTLAANAEQTVNIELQGTLPFRDAPITVYIDSEQVVIEQDETDNQLTTAQVCKMEPLDSVSAFKPKLKWHWSSSTTNPSYNQVMHTPLVGQLNDDNLDGVIDEKDIPDVIFTAYKGYSGYVYNGILRAVNGSDGSELWDDSHDRFALAFYTPAIADIDGDGLVEIVVNQGYYRGNVTLAVYDNTGALKWQVPNAWPGNIAIADLDNDGQVEIISGGTVFDATGNKKFTTGLDPSAIALDLDLDGKQEIFAAGNTYDNQGQLLWSSGHRIGAYGSFAAVGNFDADDYPEIVFYNSRNVVLLEHTGDTKWAAIVPSYGGGALTVADFDGDGESEIGIAAASNYVVYETDGSIKWQKQTQDKSSYSTGSSVFDFDGDGNAEVVYADEQFLRVYNGKSGEILIEQPNTSHTLFEYPVIVDIDNDGHSELIVISNNLGIRYSRLPDGTLVPGTNGIRVFENEADDWMPTRKIWNQHSYHINNINDDGSIPQYEQPSWLSHNSYRLNTFIDRDILALTDLTASNLILKTDNQTLTLSLRVGNAGLTHNGPTQVAFYEDGLQGRLLGTVDLAAIAPGDHQTIELSGITDVTYGSTILAVIIPPSQPGECNTMNNQASVLAQAINGQVSLQLDRSQYPDNTPVIIDTSVVNTGIYSSDYQLHWQIESSQGGLLTELTLQTVSTLASGQSSTMTSQWNTGVTLAGDYQVRVILSDLNGQQLDETIQPFSIDISTSTQPLVSSQITTDKASYSAWDNVTINTRVSNLSNNASLPATFVELTVSDPSQKILLYESQELAALTPLQRRDFSYPLILSDAPGGQYQASWRIKDALNRTLLSESATTFTVARHALQGLQGQVSASEQQLERGDTLTCSDQVNNLSASGIDNVIIKQQLLDMSQETLLSEQSQKLSLEPRGQHTLEQRDIDTQTLSSGDYACVLQAELGDQVKTLDYAIFSVSEPPINILTELNYTPGKGRMLVLMHPSTKDTSHCWGQGHYIFNASLPAFAADSPLNLAIYDQTNTLVDSEILDLNQQVYPSNQNPAMQGVDAVIEEFSANQLQFSLYTNNRLNGEWLANYHFSLTDAQGESIAQSTPFPVSCAQEVISGDTWGDFTLYAIPSRDLSFDISLPPSWVNPVADRLYLESQLHKTGWDYTIVNDPDDFSSELRSGHYNGYTLSSRRGQLSERQQKELREAVYRGESLLLLECSQEFCQDGLDEALGIEFANGKKVINYLHLIESPLFKQAQSLALHDNLAKGTLNGATLAAQGSANNSNTQGNGNTNSGEPMALSYHHYGRGHSIYIGFDLIEQALIGQETAYNTLLANSLQYLKPEQPASSYQLLPLSLSLDNQGIAVTGELRFSLPEQTRLVASSKALQSETNANGDTLYRLAIDTYRQPKTELTLWLISTDNRTWDLAMELWLEQNQALYLYKTINLSLPLEQSLDLIHHSDWGGACQGCNETLQYGLQNAQQAYENKAILQAIDELLLLTDELISVQSANTGPVPVRLWLDQGLKQVGFEQ